MMKQKIKITLKQGFEAPPPERKEEFFRHMPFRIIPMHTFFWIQFTYIRKWVWVFSALLFLAALAGACILRRDILWNVSAFMPILALTLVSESGRSKRYGMEELEQSSRFSGKMVLLARLAILGGGNLLLGFMLIPFAFLNCSYSLVQVAMFLLCPYLLTSFLGVNVLRKVSGKEADYLCVATSFFVSIGNDLLRQSDFRFYEERFWGLWVLAGIFLFGGTVYQYIKMLNQREEFIWNS